jgi:hypothetical protein
MSFCRQPFILNAVLFRQFIWREVPLQELSHSLKQRFSKQHYYRQTPDIKIIELATTRSFEIFRHGKGLVFILLGEGLNLKERDMIINLVNEKRALIPNYKLYLYTYFWIFRQKVLGTHSKLHLWLKTVKTSYPKMYEYLFLCLYFMALPINYTQESLHQLLRKKMMSSVFSPAELTLWMDPKFSESIPLDLEHYWIKFS